ncbi:MAG TPA: hypothetical protein VH277_07845 [Gemmatimonadaceae bacterium]|nr:hypothetical protein [Gemmatimonadaceae bacterium]
MSYRWFPVSFAVAGIVACTGSEPIAPSRVPPARVDAISDLNRTGAVGAAIPGAIVVKVTDSSGRATPNIAVGFAVTIGNGSVTPRVAMTDANGEARATWTLGTVVGANEVTASVAGIATPVKFDATGTSGPVSTIRLSTQNARLLATVDTFRLTARSLDAFGNATSPAPVYTVRDSSLVAIDQTGLVRALRRGAGTYIVASAGVQSDSTLVTVLAPGQSVCTAAATPVTMSVGEVINDITGGGFCVHADTSSAEYALVPFFDAGQSSASTQIQVQPFGVAPLPLTASGLRRPAAIPLVRGLEPNVSFEAALRAREEAESAKRSPGLQRLSASRDVARASAQLSVPAIGAIMTLNANANQFCDAPDYRGGRVVAVTNRAIVVADTANPAGGFTSDEYKSIGVTFDTLINPVDTAAFGNATDIDNNGRVILFFTRAVNELTPTGSPGGVVLGFYYRRDLYQKTGNAAGNCPGSNVAEMFYLMVPDTGGVVNSNRRTKTEVVSATNGTVAHEYQHLINAAQRLYPAAGTSNGIFEEKWLDEGLAHIAEDLNFWAASGLKPRTNVDNSLFSDFRAAGAYNTFGINNIRRYATYLARTETQAPVGFDVNDDDLQTRGAIWSLLRYLADQKFGASENTFWRALAGSKTSGIANLTAALGTTPNVLMRDWAISVLADDNAANLDPLYTQPSWNARSILTGGGSTFPLLTRSLADGATTTVMLAGDGVSFLRFSVPTGQDALLTVTSSGGQPLSAAVKLSVVRLR